MSLPPEFGTTAVMLKLFIFPLLLAMSDAEVLDQLANRQVRNPQAFQEAQATVAKKTFDLSIAPRQFKADRPIFEYLLGNLDVCASAGRVLGIATYHTRRTDDGRMYGEDGKGARGYVTSLKKRKGEQIFLMDGEQRGVFTVRGKSVVALQYAALEGSADLFDYRLKAWVRIESSFFAFFSRLLLNVSRKAADKQLNKLLSVPVLVSQAIHVNPVRVLDAFSAEAGSMQSDLSRLTELIHNAYPDITRDRVDGIKTVYSQIKQAPNPSTD